MTVLASIPEVDELSSTPPMERLVARIPLLLGLVGLVLLVQVALGQGDRPGLLAAGVPAALVLLAYAAAGRGRRRHSG